MSLALSIVITTLQILLGLLGIGLVIFIHELGHYLMARLLKIDVEVLSYGYGTKLVSIKGKKTEFRLSLIPFGGYCRMKGTIDLKKALNDGQTTIKVTEEGSFFAVSALKRLLVYASGPLTNFILAFILLSIASAIPVERISSQAVLLNTSSYPTLFDSPITQRELKDGDVALYSQDYVFEDFEDFIDYVNKNSGSVIPLTVLRDGKSENIAIYPVIDDEGRIEYGISNLTEPVIGRSESPLFEEGDLILEANGKAISNIYDLYEIDSDELNLVISRNGRTVNVTIDSGKLPFAWKTNLRISSDSPNAIKYGFDRTISLIESTFRALGALLTFRFNDVRDILTGPVNASRTFGRISTIAFNTSISSGIRTLIYLLAIASISICVGNTLPIPTFDGGQILMTLLELIHRKPLNPKAYIILQIAGMVIGYGFVAFMYLLDIYKFIF